MTPMAASKPVTNYLLMFGGPNIFNFWHSPCVTADEAEAGEKELCFVGGLRGDECKFIEP